MASILLGCGAASLGDRCPTFRPLKKRSPRVLETSGTDDAVTSPHVPEGSELHPSESLNPLVTYISKILFENSTGPLTAPCEAFSIFPQVLCANAETLLWNWYRPVEMWWYTCRNHISSFGETDESIYFGRGVSSIDYWQPRCAYQR